METGRRMFLCVLLWCSVKGEAPSARVIVMPEDTPMYTVVGNVFDGVNDLDTLRNDARTAISILKHGNPYADYFQITKSSGDIFLLKSIDRDDICDQVEKCEIKLDIALSSASTPVKIFRVDILVKDVNDNSPVFPKKSVEFGLFEDAHINTTFSIPSAMDADMGGNSQLTYELIPSEELFALQVTSNVDGTDDVRVILTGKLHTEMRGHYRMRIEAMDGGSPQRTGTVSVTVAVKEVNKLPVFTPSDSTTVTVEETFPIKTTVTRVTASDDDTGVNGQLRYRISAKTMYNYPDTFSVDPISGDIWLLKSLDFEEKKFYRLTVEVVDGGSPSLTSQTTVDVNVRDVNDNIPEITVDFLTGEKEAFISEASKAQHFVATISVADRDSGRNAEIRCSINDNNFELISVSDSDFHLVLKAPLDRELKSRHIVLVRCRDGGRYPNSASTEVPVIVLDANDNAPRFIETDPKVLLSKNAAEGEVIYHVTAVDDDDKDNAKIKYEILPKNQHFRVNPNSGSISVAKSLTTLSEQEVTLTIVARDGGNPFKQTRITVTISFTSSSSLDSKDSHYEDVIHTKSAEYSNLMIVLLVVVLTLVLSAILIIMICCLRGRNSSDTDEEQEKSGDIKTSTISVISTEKLTIDIDI